MSLRVIMTRGRKPPEPSAQAQERTHREEAMTGFIQAEMLAEGIVEREGEVIILHGNWGRRYMVEVKMHEVDDGR